MGDRREQSKPLALSAHPIAVDGEDEFPVESRRSSNRRCLKCCGCFIAVALILAVIILVLFFTIFRVKDPVMGMNSVTVDGFSALIGFPNLNPSLNLTIVADVSVKNPNVVSFKFDDAITSVYYDGVTVGEVRNPSGYARARRTLRMNVTVDVMVERLMGVRRLGGDVISGKLPVSSFTKISGRVRIIKIVKKDVEIRMKCTMSVNLKSQEIEAQACSRQVSL